MDSITQATLGAAVGHLFWHKQLGRSSLAVGAALGTLPDLDILLYPMLDKVQQLYWHRGESHSVWFMIFGSAFLGTLLVKYFRKNRLNYQQAATGVFFVLATHVLIDLFTVYGTQLLAPFSRNGFALNNMFIIDPLFTLPLLLGVLTACIAGEKKIGVRGNQFGLFAATLYACWSLSAQSIAGYNFDSAVKELDDVKIQRQVTSSAPFNTFLWRHIVETSDGFLLGYWSFFDSKEKTIEFYHIPKNTELVKNLTGSRNFEVVEWFSKGWWFAVNAGEGSVKIVDLRFSEIPSELGEEYTAWQWPFSWIFYFSPQGENQFKSHRPKVENIPATLSILQERVLGGEGWLSNNK